MGLKRHFYNGKEYVLDMENKVIKLLPDFHEKLLKKNLWGRFGFKKIGGSSIGDVLLTDKYKSQFVAFARMSWIGMPILDRKYVDAGIAIEPKVIDLIKKQEQVSDVETFDPKKYNWDYFAGKDDIIGGLPDGLAKPHNIVLEIKTAGFKKLATWNKFGVPLAYLKQAQLYTYLMDLEKYAIVATFLEEFDYELPAMYPIEKRTTKTWAFKINRAQVKDDIDKVKTWYKKHTRTGISPQFDQVKDYDTIKFLLCKNVAEWDALQEEWRTQGKLKV